MSKKITIGSVIPESPLIRLTDIISSERIIIRENGDVKGLYIVDLHAEFRRNPKSTVELDL